MFSLRSMFMHTVFSVVFVRLRVASEWKPYNGVLYYISEDNDTLSTYEDSEEKCKLLNGRLAALSGWPDDRNRLANFTGSTKRWISAARVIHELDLHKYVNGFKTKYHLQVAVNKSNRYGYICEWQCHSLGVYPHVQHDVMLSGVYDLSLRTFTNEPRQFYTKQSHTASKRTRIHSIWLGGNNYTWTFTYNSISYSNTSLSHFTPYNGAYPWNYYDLISEEDVAPLSITINFFCHDCWEYEVSLSLINGSTVSDTFIRLHHNPVYTTFSGDGLLRYDSPGNQWCLTWTIFLEEYCFEYTIAPTVDHLLDHVSEEGIVISLACNSTMATKRPILTETTYASEISSATASNTATTVTDTPNETTKEPKSSNVRSVDKTTIYIAIACAIGGIVIIIIISFGVVCCRRRMTKRKRDTEQNIQNHIPKSIAKANIYSVDTHSTNYIEIIDSSIVVENKTGKANSEPLYEQADDPTTENMYSEAEAVDVNNKHVYKNSFFAGSNKSQNEAGSHSSDKKTGNNTADDGNDSETEFFNNNIYEGNVNMDRKNAEVPQPVPVKSPSGSDIEMYNNTLYDASGKGIAQNNKSELVKNMDSVDEDIEMYDNDLYGS